MCICRFVVLLCVALLVGGECAEEASFRSVFGGLGLSRGLKAF